MNIVWVYGAFDIFHYGHLKLLEHAARIGELHVGIYTDDYIRDIKGIKRPIFDLSKRVRIIAALTCVHRVHVIQNDDEHMHIIRALSPTHIVTGSNHPIEKHIEIFDAKIVTVEEVKGISSTSILKNSVKRDCYFEKLLKLFIRNK